MSRERPLSFTTASGAVYLYDDASGVIVPAEGPLAGLADAPEGPETDALIQATFGRYREASSRSRPPVRPWTEERVKMETLMAPSLQVTLIVTERCTLRCRYCVYTGTYEHARTHSSTDMPLETALRAVDYLAERSRERERRNPGRIPALGFYGGEPLLRLDLIRKVVEHVARIGLKCSFNVTTNGTVDDDETVDFLARNDFNVAVSLDGPPAEHNRNRIFPDGRGSFSHAYGLLGKLRIARERHGAGVAGQTPYVVLSCADRATDFTLLRDFFDGDPQTFAKSGSRVSMIYPYRTCYYEKWSEENLRRAERTASAMWPAYVEIMSKASTPPAMSFIGTMFGLPLRSLLSSLCGDMSSMRGACVPGSRLAVDPSGRLHVCERVNSNYPLGDVEKGLDLDAVVQMQTALQNYLAEHCSDCQVKRLCGACYSHALMEKPMELEIPADFCRQTPKGCLNNLGSLFTILERNPAGLALFQATEREIEEDRIFNG
jgi:uncharacterized protein